MGRRRTARGAVLIALAALALPAVVVAGCGSTESVRSGAAATAGLDAADLAETLKAMRAIPLVSTVNGEVPPGRPTLVASSTEVLRAPHDLGIVHVFRDVRLPGTRAPIHVHPFGGWTCVAKGQATLYVEGAASVTAEAGECVNMPALTPMSNSNEGTTPAVLFDNFVAPPGAPEWRIVERGETQLGNEFGEGTHGGLSHP